MFNVSTFSDGTAIVYIDGKRYKYSGLDPARMTYLKNKYIRQPGKLFNIIKKEGVIES